MAEFAEPQVTAASPLASPRRRVLVVDDEPSFTEWLRLVIEQPETGYEVRAAARGADAEEVFRRWRPDVVLLDLQLPDGDAVALLRRLKAIDPRPEIIVISGAGTIARALEAGEAGAFFFLEKSHLGPAGLLGLLGRATGLRQERAQHERLKAQVREQCAFSNIVGRSKAMRELFDLVEAVAPSEANILVLGENGVGKELIAHALHHQSERARGPLITINCAALPHDLVESELFGYRKGAFTGATANKVGLFELASGGSLVLDEIGEMSPALQTKLLRVLQEREFRPVGGERPVRVDVRLICATNLDVEAALRSGRLREDLYFRINTVTLRVPPLRERTEDVPLLCAHFLEKFNRRYHRHVKGISPTAYHLLIRSRWPGNVRELENAIERAVLVAKSAEIEPGDLPEALRGEGAVDRGFAVPPHHTLAEIERMAVLQTLERTNWNKQEAAGILGLYRPTLYGKMRKHGIVDPRGGSRTRERR